MTAAFHPMSNVSNPEFMVGGTAALNLVAKMPDSDAAMSHYEFSPKSTRFATTTTTSSAKPSRPQPENGWTTTSANGPGQSAQADRETEAGLKIGN